MDYFTRDNTEVYGDNDIDELNDRLVLALAADGLDSDDDHAVQATAEQVASDYCITQCDASSDEIAETIADNARAAADRDAELINA